MFLIYLFVLSVVSIISGDEVDDYMDTLITMMMYGDSIDNVNSKERDEEQAPEYTGGIWKCGDCNDIDHTKLIYTEVNDVDADMRDDQPLEIQVGLALPDMRCVTLKTDVRGVVKRISGTCEGDTVTLTVSPPQHFIVNVYS